MHAVVSIGERGGIVARDYNLRKCKMFSYVKQYLEVQLEKFILNLAIRERQGSLLFKVVK